MATVPQFEKIYNSTILMSYIFFYCRVFLKECLAEKKTNVKIGKTTSETMRNAVSDVLNGGLSAKAAAIKHNIPRSTLRRYLKKCNDKADQIDWNSPFLEGAPRLTPNYSINQIFSCQEEDVLSEYFQTMSKLHHGMTPKCARKLAYDLAVANGKKNTCLVGRK